MGRKTGPRPQPLATLMRPQDLPTKASLSRLRVEYGKDERLAYLGHLEVIATVERCIRRAGLPFSIGNGFARRMRIQFSQALPVGASSAHEYFDLRLDERVDVDRALEALRVSTPPALAPVRAAYVDGSMPALEAWLDRSAWDVVVLGAPFSPAELDVAIAHVREVGALTYLRGDKEKSVDVSSALVSWEVGECADGISLALATRSSNAGSLRPGVLVDGACRLAGLDPYDVLRVRRTGQWHESDDGSLVEAL